MPLNFAIILMSFVLIIVTKYIEVDKRSLKHRKMRYTYYEIIF
jgi:hypothetical protein